MEGRGEERVVPGAVTAAGGGGGGKMHVVVAADIVWLRL